MRRYARISSLLIWLLLASTGAYAYARLGEAAPQPGASATSGPSGYATSGIHYSLSAADPSRIARVAFTLSPRGVGSQPQTVRVKLIGAGSYFPCANTPPGSASWECPVSGVPVAAADLLTLDVAGSASPPKYVLWLPLIRR
jgi:hypothetical protein